MPDPNSLPKTAVYTSYLSWGKLTRDEICNSEPLSHDPNEKKKQNSQTIAVSKEDYYETEWHPWDKAFKFLAL